MPGDLRIRDEVEQVGFVQCSSLLLFDRRITDGAFRLYMLLRWYCRNKDFCFPGKERLAKDMGVTPKHICKHLKVLKEAGLISVERRGGGKTNLYWIEPISALYSKEGRLTDEVMEICSFERVKDEECGLDKIKKKRVVKENIVYTKEEESKTSPILKPEVSSKQVFIEPSNGERKKKEEGNRQSIVSDRIAEIRKQRETQALLAGQTIAKRKGMTRKDLTVKDLEVVWHEQFEQHYPQLPDVRWYEDKRKFKMAKNLITRYGGEEAKQLIVFMFANWAALERSYAWVTGMPTLQLLVTMGDAWLEMAVEGKPVKLPKERKQNRGEYNEEREKDSPTFGWGKD